MPSEQWVKDVNRCVPSLELVPPHDRPAVETFNPVIHASLMGMDVVRICLGKAPQYFTREIIAAYMLRCREGELVV